MRGISLKAIVLATLATIGVDIVSGFVLMTVFGGPVFEPDMSDEQLKEAFAALNANVAYLLWALILGTMSTVLGGYLAARIAGTVPYFNALAFGVVGVLMGALSAVDLPVWFTVIGLGVTIPAALIGGHLAKQQTSVG